MPRSNVIEIFNEIRDISVSLQSLSIAQDFNYPKIDKITGCNETDEGITWKGNQDISFVLRDFSYEDKYNFMIEKKQFNFKLFDGAIFQFMYAFKRKVIVKHRLCYFPFPEFVIKVPDISDIYEQQLPVGINDLADTLYDIFDSSLNTHKKISEIKFPVRFDYDSTARSNHPIVHLTMGEHKNCRIPVSAPLTPKRFMHFLLKHFYNNIFSGNNTHLNFNSKLLTSTIRDIEKEEMHLHFE